MKMARPTAERLLSAFGSLHQQVQPAGTQVPTHMVKPLSPLHQYILDVLHLSPFCYDLTRTFTVDTTGCSE